MSTSYAMNRSVDTVLPAEAIDPEPLAPELVSSRCPSHLKHLADEANEVTVPCAAVPPKGSRSRSRPSPKGT